MLHSAHLFPFLPKVLHEHLGPEAGSLSLPLSGSLHIACPLILPKLKGDVLLVNLEHDELLSGENGEHFSNEQSSYFPWHQALKNVTDGFTKGLWAMCRDPNMSGYLPLLLRAIVGLVGKQKGSKKRTLALESRQTEDPNLMP